HTDALGTTGMMSAQTNGVWQDSLYYPFGALWRNVSCQCDMRFAGMEERDAATNLDPTPARDYASNLGRWMTPDPDNAGADPSNPQSWNAYSYALNNPTTNTDPSGLDCLYVSSQSVTSIFVSTQRGNCTEAGGIYINGTVDLNSLTYTGTSLGYSFTPYSGGSGAGVIDFTSGPSSEQQALQTLSLAGQMASAQLNSYVKALGVAATAEVGGEFLGAALEGVGGAEEETAAAMEAKAGPALGRLSPKIQNQMATRGWTRQDILDVFEKGEQTQVVDRTAGGAPATQYLDPETGQFIVVNDKTGNVIQVSGPGFRPNPPVR
ncbi:MAG: RHS repeat-associated core domain-containing protein, partial [Terriglobia bacterium]